MRDESVLPLLLILGLGGVVVWLYFRKQESAQAPPCGVPASAFGVSTVVPCGVIKDAANVINPASSGSIWNRLNKAITGVGVDTFKTSAEMSDFDAAKHSMCACYHGNQEACVEAKFMIPGLVTCKPGDCDCNPTFDGKLVKYRDSRGGPYYAPLVHTKAELYADVQRRGVKF